jgi:hypothetical protein
MAKVKNVPKGTDIWRRGFHNIQSVKTNYKATCKFCTKTYSGPSSRFPHHLLRNKGHGIAVCSFSATAIDPDLAKELEELVAALKTEHAGQERARQREQQVALTAACKAGRGQQQSILYFANAEATEEANLRLAALVAETGMSFIQTQQPAFQEFVDAVRKVRVGHAWYCWCCRCCRGALFKGALCP